MLASIRPDSALSAFVQHDMESAAGREDAAQRSRGGDNALTDRSEHDRIDAEITRSDASNDPFAAAVRATRMPMLITDPHLPDNPIVFVNAAFSKLTGYRHEEIIGSNCRFLQGPETNRDDIAKIRDAIERRVAIEIDLRNYKKSGDIFWNRLLISPVFNLKGDLTYFFASQFDVTLERERLQNLTSALKDRERMLDALLHSSTDVRYKVNADWSRVLHLDGSVSSLTRPGKILIGWMDTYLLKISLRCVLRSLGPSARRRPIIWNIA